MARAAPWVVRNDRAPVRTKSFTYEISFMVFSFAPDVAWVYKVNKRLIIKQNYAHNFLSLSGTLILVTLRFRSDSAFHRPGGGAAVLRRLPRVEAAGTSPSRRRHSARLRRFACL